MIRKITQELTLESGIFLIMETLFLFLSYFAPPHEWGRGVDLLSSLKPGEQLIERMLLEGYHPPPHLRCVPSSSRRGQTSNRRDIPWDETL